MHSLQVSFFAAVANINGWYINIFKCVKISYEMLDFDLMIVSFLSFHSSLVTFGKRPGPKRTQNCCIINVYLSKAASSIITLFENFIIIAVLFVLFYCNRDFIVSKITHFAFFVLWMKFLCVFLVIIVALACALSIFCPGRRQTSKKTSRFLIITFCSMHYTYWVCRRKWSCAHIFQAKHSRAKAWINIKQRACIK